MKNSLLLIMGTGERFVSVANEAMRIAMPGGASRLTATLGQAAGSPEEAPVELLVMENPSELDASQATDIQDALHLPRWAVVICGEDQGIADAEAVPAAQWTVEIVSRVFRMAIAAHLLRRENQRFRGDLLAIGVRIAHDLRTPLGGMLVSAEALREHLARTSPGEVALTHQIVESEEDMLKIVRQLTALTNAFAGAYAPAKLNMGVPLAAALDRLEGRIGRRKAKISRPDSWPEVVGDSQRIEGIWVGLIENSLIHGGEARRIDLGWLRVGDEFRFSVRDDGAGVPKEKHGLLFYPFHRLHEPGAARGLGLAVVERLVRMQGGRCGYESGDAWGSHFYFTLPAHPPAASAGTA